MPSDAHGHRRGDPVIKVDVSGAVALQAELRGAGKQSDLAALRALKRVGDEGRREAVNTISDKLKLRRKKTLNKRLKVYPGNLRTMRVRVWHGTEALLDEADLGVRRIRDGRSFDPEAAPNSALFRAKMPTGKVGLFYRSPPRSRKVRAQRFTKKGKDLPVRKAAVNVGRLTAEIMPPKVTAVHDRKYNDLYWRDLRYRLNKRRGRRR